MHLAPFKNLEYCIIWSLQAHFALQGGRVLAAVTRRKGVTMTETIAYLFLS